MKVEFIHHSSIYVETENNILIFDYVSGNNDKFQFKGKLPELNNQKDIYFFVSHAHADHYDSTILDIQRKYQRVRIVADKSVGIGRAPIFNSKKKLDYNILKVDFGRKYKLGNIEIKTIKSTEAGVAYIVNCDGKTVYHAGDLALWYWDGVGELINGRETAAYKREISKLANEHIDVACVPLDSRMKGHAGDGMLYFMENVDADFIVPIHMWEDYDYIRTFKSKCSNSAFANRLSDISHENEILKND